MYTQILGILSALYSALKLKVQLTTENSNNTTKWRAPYIVHYIRDREQFQTQLMAKLLWLIKILAKTR